MTTKLTVAYTRVSTATQNLDRQFADAERFDRVYSDKVSGVVPFAERPAGKRLLTDVANGLVGEVNFWEVARVGRDIADITLTLQGFVKSGVQVIVHKEGIKLLDDAGGVNTTAQLVLAVMTALASIERQNIRERQLEGIAVAKAKGKYLGRRLGSHESAEAFLSKPKSRRIREMLVDRCYPATHIARVLGVSYTTVRKVKLCLQVAT